MSAFMITNNERLTAIAKLPPLPYFVHEQVVVNMLGFNNITELNIFLKGIKNGIHLLNNEPFAAINLDASDDNVLHFHRHKHGDKIKIANRIDITNEPTTNVLRQQEIYYTFGLHQQQQDGINLSLSNQVKLARDVVGEINNGLITGETIKIRKEQWLSCMSGNNDEVRKLIYFQRELPNIVQTHGDNFGIEIGEGGRLGSRIEDLHQARGKIAKLLQYTHVMPPTLTEDISIVKERRTAIRFPGGEEREEEAQPQMASSPVKQKKTRRRKVTNSNNGEEVSVAVDATATAIEASVIDESEFTAKEKRMVDILGFGVMKELWQSKDDDKRIEVGRRELLLRGVLENYDRKWTNARIKRHGGLPYSIDDYNALVSAKKKQSRRVSRLLTNFVNLRNNVINEHADSFRLHIDMSILIWIRTYQRVNMGIDILERQMKIDGLLTPEATACIRHILYTHPKIGWCDFNRLLAESAVLLLGRPLSKDDFASLSTVRYNIARLDALDMLEIKDMYSEFLKTKSPCGNDVFFGGGSDETKQGKFDVRNVLLTVLDMGKTARQKELAVDEPKGWEQYKLDLAIHVSASGKSDDNVESNLDALLEHVPIDLLYRYKLHSLDNCNTAVKEGRDTTAATTEHTEPNDESKTHIHGVPIVGKTIRDPFHIFQLQCKHFSETFAGQTEKGKHDLLHHRSLIQHIYNHYIRDEALFRQLEKRILATFVDEDGKPIPWRAKPSRELDTRWGSNARACENILEGLHIVNHNGENFWQLLFLEFRAEYGGWKEESIDRILTMLSMESIIFGLWAEYEGGQYFNAHYNYHAQPGELCKHPGFRYMEWIFELCDHAYPFWTSLRRDKSKPDEIPEGFSQHFPKTMAYLQSLEDEASLLQSDDHPSIVLINQMYDDADNDPDNEELQESELSTQRLDNLMEAKRLQNIVKLKREQLDHAVEKSVDELAKLTEDTFDPFTVVLFLLHPIHGPAVLRALLQLAIDGEFNLDGHWEGDDGVDTSDDITWGTMSNMPQTSKFGKIIYEKLKGKEKEVIHSLCMHGLYKLNCRRELKMLSIEPSGARDNNSAHRLQDFHSQYPEIFDCLHSWFARSMSNTRPIEGAHGFQRSSWDSQRTFERNNAQLRYLMLIEYRLRHARRTVAYAARDVEEDEYKAAKKASAKHSDTMDLQVMAGEQLYELIQRYTEDAISERHSPEVLQKYTIRNIAKRGMKHKDRKYAEARERISKQRQAKRTNNSRYTEKYHDEIKLSAKHELTEHDRLHADSPAREKAKRAIMMLKRKWWDSVPKDIFMEELKEVLPNFYSKWFKSLRKGKQTYQYIMRSAKTDCKDDKPTNCLVLYLKAVVKIAQKKIKNDLMSKRDANLIADKSYEDILAEFVKVDESQHLANTLQEDVDKLDVMKSVMDENGRDITDNRSYDNVQATAKEFKNYEIRFEHIHPSDKNDNDENRQTTSSRTLAWWDMEVDELPEAVVEETEEVAEEEEAGEDDEQDNHDMLDQLSIG